MKLRFRFTLLAAVFVLMAISLGAVSSFVLIRNNESSQAISELQAAQAATDVEERIRRFLESGPRALARLQRLVDHRFLDLDDGERLQAYLVSEMRADRDLSWLSYSDVAQGTFLGVTRRDGGLILNRSDPEVDAGRPREWEIGGDGTLRPAPPRRSEPYDPRASAWFRLGLDAAQPRWTDFYKFAEGEWGVSTVLRVRPPGSGGAGGVATADFHLKVIDEFLAQLRVGDSGRAAVIVPQTGGEPALLGRATLPQGMRMTLDRVVREARVGAAGGEPPAHWHLDEAQVGFATEVRALEPGSGLRWFLAVMVPPEQVYGPIQRATRDIILVCASFLALGVAVAVWMANAITRPIRSMCDDLRRVSELRLSTGPADRSFIQEMDTMSRSLAAMKTCLRSFSYYVPVELVRALLDSGQEVEPRGETREMTILFTDIADFTRIAEGLPPERLSHELGAYFDVIDRAVTEAGGVVDKFMGDGAMAFFNAPNLQPDHAARAAGAALAAQRLLRGFNAAREADGKAPFHTRIGLALGPAVVGNIGTSHRLSYTAIGDVVNLSSHLESLNKVYGTAILGEDGLRRQAGDGFEWRHLDRIAVAGRTAPVELFELMGRKGEVEEAALRIRDLHEAALATLIAGDFDLAERGFAAVLVADPRDHAARVLLAYTEEMRHAFQQVRGDAAWSGVHVYSSKGPR